MVTLMLMALLIVMVLLASLVFITGGIVAARSDARDEELYRVLLSPDPIP